ncbi:bifunctional metallophosphatase/5'-nucleotidase [Anaeroselena agilis]|uniref:5'-nucleotidase C-terminal domain-containing protein n=1 Tax=Anaeroselena agilis TaxID=3063788 RepID=A0ABU3NYN4_9FIRM|nr:5'-nucleotidase C-terminal domain-containing protein [Selenomonadales bacterium 4137-cl]
MRTLRRLAAILLILTLALPVSAAAAASRPGVVRIDILAVNDFHGALSAAGKNPGAAALAAYLKAERDKNPAGTLILSAGDMFQGTPDSNLLLGKTVVEFMNAAGFDAMTIGNHEFDWGLDVLRQRMAQAAFPVVSANIVDRSTGRRAGLVPPYVILERAGVKIAVVGFTTPDTAVTTNPRIVKNYLFADPATTVKALVPELKARGADIVVALGHLASYPGEQPGGEAADLAAAAGGDLAAVISGHSHLRVAGKVAGVPVVQACYNGRAVAAVRIAYSAAGREVLGTAVEVKDIPPGLAPDKRVAAIVAATQSEVAPVKGIVLGEAATALPHDRYRLSPLGQWATDALRQAAGADIAFFNGGGLRAGLAAGPVTLGDLYAAMPFDGCLEVAEMTGAQVLAALEYGIANPRFGALQFSGLEVEYRAAAPAGQRVAATLADGRALEADKTYRVAVNDFLAAGGDGYEMIKAAAHQTNTFLQLRDVLAAAVRKAGIIRFLGDTRLKELSRSAAPFIAA